MSSSENNNATGRGGVARKVEVASSAISLVVASSVTIYATRPHFGIIMLIVFAWVTLPYIAFFVVTTYLYSGKPNTALPRAAATIAILMLAFTSLVYIDGMLIHPDGQSGLLFVVVPVYLLVGGFVTLGIWLAFGARLHSVGHCQECGYNLRGLIEPRCPECGTPFDEKLLNKDA